MSNNGFVKTAGSIVVSVDGKPYSVNSGNKALYDEVYRLVKEGNFAAVPDAVDRLGAISKKIEQRKDGFDSVTVRDRRVYLVHADGSEQRLVGYEVNKLLDLMDEGFDIKPLTNFILRVRQNPSEAVRSRLYEFMEYGNMPLVADGSFLAYKVVGADYKDKHSHTFDNSVGKTCEMKRCDVDDDDNRTCSRGLHVCSKEYIKSFLYSGNDHLMVAKVGPEDVVSIPVDYNNTKMRTAKYEIIGEIQAQDDPEFFGKAVYQPTVVDDETPVEEVQENREYDSLGRVLPRRDAKGHFIRG